MKHATYIKIARCAFPFQARFRYAMFEIEGRVFDCLALSASGPLKGWPVALASRPHAPPFAMASTETC